MKKIYFAMLFCLCCLFVTSCSSTPKPATFQFSFQKKMQAAHHWEILAKDFSTQVTVAMQRQSSDMLNSPGFGHATETETEPSEIKNEKAPQLHNLPYVYIQNNDRSIFGKTFRSQLITELVNLGYSISTTPKNALTVNWSVNKIYHRANRTASATPGSTTIMTAIGAGIYKLWDSNPVFPAAMGTAAALDLIDNFGRFSTFNSVPHSEINITFSVSKNGLILSRQSGTYYINDKDSRHYSNIPDYAGYENPPQAKTFTVVTYSN